MFLYCSMGRRDLVGILAMIKKRNKYNAKKVTIDGITFASGKEGRRYGELKLLERAREIFDLKLQPRFPIIIKNFKICTYVADFQYLKLGDPYETVEDCKGFKTPIYKLKKKLMLAVYGIEVLET